MNSRKWRTSNKIKYSTQSFEGSKLTCWLVNMSTDAGVKRCLRTGPWTDIRVKEWKVKSVNISSIATCDIQHSKSFGYVWWSMNFNSNILSSSQNLMDCWSHLSFPRFSSASIKSVRFHRKSLMPRPKNLRLRGRWPTLKKFDIEKACWERSKLTCSPFKAASCVHSVNLFIFIAFANGMEMASLKHNPS